MDEPPVQANSHPNHSSLVSEFIIAKQLSPIWNDLFLSWIVKDENLVSQNIFRLYEGS